MPVYPEFSQYLRGTGVTADGERIKLLFKALENFAKEHARPSLDFVRRIASIPPAKEEAFALLHAKLFEVDASFDLVLNKNEFEGMCAAFVGHTIFHADKLTQDRFSLAVATSLFGAKQISPAQSNILSQAEVHLQKSSLALRNKMGEEVKGVNAKELKKIDATKVTAEDLLENFKKSVAQINDIAVECARLAKVCVTYKDHLSLYREESDILWWLFSGYSRTLKINGGGVTPSESLPIMLGYEMATLITSIPGPTATREILWKMLHGFNAVPETNLGRVIGNLSHEHAVLLTADKRAVIDLLTPIHFAAKLASEFPGSEAWKEVYRTRAVNSLDLNANISSVDFSLQVTRERMLLSTSE
jgi:GTPase-associated system helical domain